MCISFFDKNLDRFIWREACIKFLIKKFSSYDLIQQKFVNSSIKNEWTVVIRMSRSTQLQSAYWLTVFDLFEKIFVTVQLLLVNETNLIHCNWNWFILVPLLVAIGF